METELEITKRAIARKQQPAGRIVLSPGVPNINPPAPPAETALSNTSVSNIATETDRDLLRDRYNGLFKQRDELASMRTAAAGMDPGLFQIVDPPAEPAAPSGPNRSKLYLLAIALALAAGLVLVAAVETPRFFSIRDERDVSYYLGAPVLALIPETCTPVERGRARRMFLVRMLSLVLLGFVLVPGLVLVLNELSLFQSLAARW
jgi:hypothetical protein